MRPLGRVTSLVTVGAVGVAVILQVGIEGSGVCGFGVDPRVVVRAVGPARVVRAVGPARVVKGVGPPCLVVKGAGPGRLVVIGAGPEKLSCQKSKGKFIAFTYLVVLTVLVLLLFLLALLWL